MELKAHTSKKESIKTGLLHFYGFFVTRIQCVLLTLYRHVLQRYSLFLTVIALNFRKTTTK